MDGIYRTIYLSSTATPSTVAGGTLSMTFTVPTDRYWEIQSSRAYFVSIAGNPAVNAFLRVYATSDDTTNPYVDVRCDTVHGADSGTYEFSPYVAQMTDFAAGASPWISVKIPKVNLPASSMIEIGVTGSADT